MRSILEIIGIIVAVFGVLWAIWETHQRKAQGVRETQQRKAQGDKMFYFLKGVKSNAVGNQNNTGDTSQSWKALVEQIDDIIRWLQK